MFNRNALLLVAGAAIFTLDASAASAQAKKPTSTKRIPITKEAPGEVAPHVDTVKVYVTDTLRLRGRTDTVTRTQTVTQVRVDTVINNVPMVAHHYGGMYVGLGGGTNLPFGAIRTVNSPGVAGQALVGWQSLNSVLGFRVDGNWTQFSDNAVYAPLGDRAQMMGANADVRLDLPLFENFLGGAVRFRPYLLAGGSVVRYHNLRMKLDTDNGQTGGYGPQHAIIAGNTSNSTTAAGVLDDSWHTDPGFNFGGGLGFHAGKKEAFVEARAVHFNRDSNRFTSSWAIPIIFGVNFF